MFSDFGFATSTYKNKPLETFCGSFAYACPQILRGENYDGMAADVWSVGVVLYALCCSRLPYGDEELKLFVKNETPKKLMFTKNVTKGINIADNILFVKIIYPVPRVGSRVNKHPYL